MAGTGHVRRQRRHTVAGLDELGVQRVGAAGPGSSGSTLLEESSTPPRFRAAPHPARRTSGAAGGCVRLWGAAARATTRPLVSGRG